jgi:nitrilase
MTIVYGINECDRQKGAGTLYNSVVVIGTNGEILNRHRKLMPANPKRMMHGWFTQVEGCPQRIRRIGHQHG